jgi:DNA-binding XRE family transcriptional regulator
LNRSLYGERDYAFGQMMLTLRTTIGLTQAGLADGLGISRRAVAQWEAGKGGTCNPLRHVSATPPLWLALGGTCNPLRHVSATPPLWLALGGLT